MEVDVPSVEIALEEIVGVRLPEVVMRRPVELMDTTLEVVMLVEAVGVVLVDVRLV